MNADFFETIGETKVPEVPKEGNGYDGPPRFNWLNGIKSPGAKFPDTPGSFYIAEREIQGFTPGEPWVEEERQFRKSTEHGWTAPAMGVVLIARRSKAFRNIKDGTGAVTDREFHPKWFARDTFNEIPRSQLPPGVTGPSESVYTEYLCLADGWYGLDEDGNVRDPVVTVWTMRGMVGKRIEELVKAYRSGLLAAAESYAKRKLPLWTFRLPFAPLVDAKGRVKFEPIPRQQTFYQPPMLVGLSSTASDITKEKISQLYMGKEFLENTGYGLFMQYQDWREWVRPDGPSRSPVNGARQAEPEIAQYDADGNPIYEAPGRVAVGAGVLDESDADSIPF